MRASPIGEAVSETEAAPELCCVGEVWFGVVGPVFDVTISLP